MKTKRGVSLDEINCGVAVGYRDYAHLSGEYETYRINLTVTTRNLQHIAATILTCVVGHQSEAYTPIFNEGQTKGIKIVVAAPIYEQPKSFTYTYTPLRKLKRYPWYPWSSTCDALRELPTFGIVGAPGQQDHLLWDNRRDLREPHAICIGGYPKGLIRLARLLLDYANMDWPLEEIDLEIEGGFRGVGPCSYEARFKRID